MSNTYENQWGNFGKSISSTPNGEFLVISQNRSLVRGYFNIGEIHIYKLNNGLYERIQNIEYPTEYRSVDISYLDVSNNTIETKTLTYSHAIFFGHDVKISPNGEYILVTALYDPLDKNDFFVTIKDPSGVKRTSYINYDDDLITDDSGRSYYFDLSTNHSITTIRFNQYGAVYVYKLNKSTKQSVQYGERILDNNHLYN